MNKKDIILVTILFLVALWLWTLPIKNNPLPFGEGDAAWHFANGDWAAHSDKSFWRSPPYIAYWYYGYNTILGEAALEYPPPWHLNEGIMQIIGGERFVPVFIYIAITCFLFIFSTYFLIRKLYGALPAFLVGFGLIFSLRNIMVYLWGQRPTTASYAFIPIILYSFYKYFNSHMEGKERPIYLYITVLLMAGQYMFHLMGLIITVPVVLIFAIFLSIKNRKFPVTKSNLKTILICSFIFLILTMPFILIYLGGGGQVPTSIKIQKISSLFHWFEHEGPDVYPAARFPYSQLYGNHLLPFLFLGIIFLLIRRKDKDILLLSWLVGMYLVLHLDVLNLGKIGRISRLLVAESYLFYSIIVIGLVNLISLIKLPNQKKKYIKYALVVLFLISVTLIQGKQAYSTLNNAYQGILRITPYQYEYAEWIDKNLPKDALVHTIGPITYPKMRFIHVLSHRFLIDQSRYSSFHNHSLVKEKNLTVDYLLIDYSDLIQLQNQERFRKYLNYTIEWEKSLQPNLTLIYEGKYHRIYKIKDNYLSNPGDFPFQFL